MTEAIDMRIGSLRRERGPSQNELARVLGLKDGIRYLRSRPVLDS